MINKSCKICGKTFQTRKPSKKKKSGIFCSIGCSAYSQRKRTKRKCLFCKKEFEIPEAWIRKGGGKFCSKKCKNNSQKGKPSWNKGKRHPQITGDKNPNWKGDNATYESIHQWLSRWYKKKSCEFCNNKENLEWSCKNGLYLRKRKDYRVLCRKCHRGLDAKSPKSKFKNSRLVFDKIVPSQKYPKQRLEHMKHHV